MSRYRQTMSELLEQVRQQDFTEGHSDKDFKPYPDWKKTAGGRYPRFKHSKKGEIEVDRYGEWLHSNKSGKTIAFYRNHFPKTNTTGGTSMKLTDYLKKINEEVIDESDAYDNNRYMMKKYGSQILARPDNSNTKDGKDHVYAPNAQIAKQLYKQGKKVYREEADHEISMARGELEAIADKATQLASMLQGKSDEGNPLEAWVQSKITKAKDYINSVSDYLTYNPDMKQNEETELEEAMSDAQLKKVRDSYKDLKTISPEKVKTLRNFLDRYSTDSLMQLAQANINFVSTMARSVMNKRKMGDPKHAGSMKEEVKTDSQKIADLRVRQMMLQTKVRDMNPTKDKTDIEIAKNKLDNIELRMDKIKSKNEEVELQEKIEGLANKSEKSGVPYGILKKVYDRGMAAWKGGHRPGTTPQQWAFARVNSFLTGGKTRTTADADLWQKAKAAKSKK